MMCNPYIKTVAFALAMVFLRTGGARPLVVPQAGLLPLSGLSQAVNPAIQTINEFLAALNPFQIALQVCSITPFCPSPPVPGLLPGPVLPIPQAMPTPLFPLGQGVVPLVPLQNTIVNPVPVIPLQGLPSAAAVTMFKGLQPLSTVVPNLVNGISNLVQPDGPGQPVPIIPLRNDAGPGLANQQNLPLPTAMPVPTSTQPMVAQGNVQDNLLPSAASLLKSVQAVVAPANQQEAPLPTPIPIQPQLNQPVVPLPNAAQLPLVSQALGIPAAAPAGLSTLPRNMLGLLSFATSEGPSDADSTSEASGPLGQQHPVKVNLSPLSG
eukprot:jgi/Botrbrau1/1503/Bobra.178_3s0055.1